MNSATEANEVWKAHKTYKSCCEALRQKQELTQKQVTIPEFIFPTPDFHPDPNAKKALEAKGFVHRGGDYGVGYYADNVR